MKKNIKFEVELDDKNLPINIVVDSTDGELEGDIKALMFSAWSSKKKETLRLDLWTKDMLLEEMFIMYYQTMLGMAESLERSTGKYKLAGALRDYCSFFSEETNILKNK